MNVKLNPLKPAYRWVELSFNLPTSEDQSSPTFNPRSCIGYHFFVVPKKEVSDFKEKVAREGGKLEEDSSDILHYSFSGSNACITAQYLSLPYMLPQNDA